MINFRTLESQNEWLSYNLPEMDISQLIDLKKSLIIYDCEVTDNLGQRVWLYKQQIEEVEAELKLRRGF